MLGIHGLRLYKNIIPTSKLQTFVFNELNELFFFNKSALQRQVIHFGYEYDYSIKEPQTKKLKKSIDPPEWIECLGNIFFEQGLLKNKPNQFILNKYSPGEGISAHRDHHPIFGNSIATLSLGSEYNMEFKTKFGENQIFRKEELSLPVGSLLVMSDNARYFWTHEIKKRKTDIRNNKRIKRENRISITFRTVNEEFI
tara:strand:- start:957 stop:1550 length:594 start_codon:yes stop_codon:yes gene_type:complete